MLYILRGRPGNIEVSRMRDFLIELLFFKVFFVLFFRLLATQNLHAFLTISDHIEPFWTKCYNSGPFRPFWTTLEHFGPFWTILDHFGKLDHFGPIGPYRIIVDHCRVCYQRGPPRLVLFKGGKSGTNCGKAEEAACKNCPMGKSVQLNSGINVEKHNFLSS